MLTFKQVILLKPEALSGWLSGRALKMNGLNTRPLVFINTRSKGDGPKKRYLQQASYQHVLYSTATQI